MRVSLQLLNWYWWRNRFSVIVMVSFVIIAQLAFWLGSKDLTESNQSLLGMMLLVSMMASSFSAITVFAAGKDIDLASGQSAFPTWWYSLPISSAKLAMIPVVGMIIALAWAWIPFGWATSMRMPSVSILDLVVLPWLGMCAAASWLQAAAWRPFRTGWHRLGAIVVALLVFALLIALGSVLPAWYRTVAVISVAVTGFAAAFLSVFQARYHGWRSEMSSTDVESDSTSTASNASLASFTKLNLSSSTSALYWRDWTQIGRFVALYMLVISIAAILVVIFGTPSITNIMLMMIVPTGLISAISTTLGKDSYFQSNFEMPHFLAALPVSNRRFLKSRLVNGLRVSVVLWCMGFLVFPIWLLKPGSLVQLQGLVGSLEQVFPSGFQSGWPMLMGCVLFTLYSAIVVPIPGLAIGLSGRKSLELGVAITLGAVGLIILMSGSFYVVKLLERLATPESKSQYIAWLISLIPSILSGLLVAKLLFTAGSFWVARKRVALNWSSVAGQLAVGFVVCSLLVALFCSLIPASLIPIQCIAMIVVLLFPCASLILAYVALDWNRHR